MKNIILPGTLKFTFIFSIAALMASCGGGETAKDTSAENTVVADSTAQPAEEVDQVSYNLPSPLQIASLFKKSGLKFLEGITNNQKDPSKYTANYTKSLNLGVYGADLAYCVLNKQSQDALTYMKASTQLASSLGMTSIFEEGGFVKRFEKNINAEDSLRNIIAELQMATDTYLEDNEQQQISAIAFAGAWTEAMYIGSRVFEKSKDKRLNNKISEQMTILSKIVNVLKTHQSKDPGIATLVADMNTLLDTYNNFESVKKSKTVSEDDSSGLVVELTETETAELIKKITELRNKFVNS